MSGVYWGVSVHATVGDVKALHLSFRDSPMYRNHAQSVATTDKNKSGTPDLLGAPVFYAVFRSKVDIFYVFTVRNGRDAAAPEARDVGPASDLRKLFVVDVV